MKQRQFNPKLVGRDQNQIISKQHAATLALHRLIHKCSEPLLHFLCALQSGELWGSGDSGCLDESAPPKSRARPAGLPSLKLDDLRLFCCKKIIHGIIPPHFWPLSIPARFMSELINLPWWMCWPISFFQTGVVALSPANPAAFCSLHQEPCCPHSA
jgi:hypothetical protein